MAIDPRAKDILVRTIIGEAANQGPIGQAAVAHVILNRARDGRWPGDPARVALQPKQFSAWNKGEGGNHLPHKYRDGDRPYEAVERVVDAVLQGRIADPTGGAVYYYAPAGMKGGRAPKWWGGATGESGGYKKIGAHLFAGRVRGSNLPHDDVSRAALQYASADTGTMTDASPYQPGATLMPPAESEMPHLENMPHLRQERAPGGYQPGASIDMPEMPDFTQAPQPPALPALPSAPEYTPGGAAGVVPTVAPMESVKGANIRTVNMTIPKGINGTPPGTPSEASIERQRAVAKAMMGGDIGRIDHPLQGIAHVAQKAFGAIGSSMADRKEEARRKVIEAQAEAKRRAQADFLAQAVDPSLSGLDENGLRTMAELYPELAQDILKGQVEYNRGAEERNYERAWEQDGRNYDRSRDQIGDERYDSEQLYKRHRDQIGDVGTQYDREYTRYRDGVGDARDERDHLYTRERDQFGDIQQAERYAQQDAQWEAEFLRQTGRYATEDDRWRYEQEEARRRWEEEQRYKAPPTTEAYDPDTGREQRMVLDPETRQYVPLGGVKAPTSKGNGITVRGPDGSLIQIGGDGDLTSTNQTAAQMKTIEGGMASDRLERILGAYQDDYGTYGGRIGYALRGIQAGLKPDSITPEQQQAYGEFIGWKSRTLNNMNQFIKEMTGAAVGVQEAQRLQGQMPNLDDDPIAFKAKLDAVADELRHSVQAWERAQGLHQSAPQGAPQAGPTLDAAAALQQGQATPGGDMPSRDALIAEAERRRRMRETGGTGRW